MLEPLRRAVLVGVVIFSLSAPAFGASSALPKPGTPCPKAQMQISYNGLYIACLKYGKKLLWSPVKKISSNSNHQEQNQPAIPKGMKPLVNAGRFGIVRNNSSNGPPMDCTKSDGNMGFRSLKTFTVDPNNPLHLSLGVEFLGFYISEDGGKNWKDSSAGLIGYPRMDNPLKPCHTEFSDIAVDPNNSQHMILSRASAPGTIKDLFSENAGLYETRNGGHDWNQILTQPNIGVYVKDGVAISHQNPNVIYAGTTTNSRMLGGSNKVYPTIGIVYKTVNGGKSWVELPTGAPLDINVLTVFIDPLDDNIVTVATGGRIISASGPTFNVGMGIIRTIDGGKSWNRLDTLNVPLMNVAFSDNSPKNVVACCSTEYKLIFSSDGGATWQANVAIFDPRAFRFDPFDKTGLSGLVADTDGAIYKFQSGGAVTNPVSALPSVPGLSTRITQFGFGSDGAWYAAGHYTGQRSGSPYQEGFVFKSTDQGHSWVRILDSTKLEH